MRAEKNYYHHKSELLAAYRCRKIAMFVLRPKPYKETGVHKSLLQLADHKAKIPMMGTINSLNVSVATGILLYEAVRQRQ